MPPSNHTVYLTFDDGPRWGTDDVISVLQNKQVRGTLLMTGNHVDSDSMRKILHDARRSRFVEIGNHSSTHAKFGRHFDFPRYYADPAGVLAGFKKANRTLGLVGNPYIVARLPGRDTWRVQHIVSDDSGWNIFRSRGDSSAAADLLARSGFKIFGWDIEWNKNKSKDGTPFETPQLLLFHLKQMLLHGATKSHGKIVVLTHDTMFRASTGGRQKLEEFIDLLLLNGFRMDFLSNYINYRHSLGVNEVQGASGILSDRELPN